MDVERERGIKDAMGYAERIRIRVLNQDDYYTSPGDGHLLTLAAEVRRLRDQRRFDAACAAMQGFIASTGTWDKLPSSEQIAANAVTWADALLAALAPDPEKQP